MANNKFSRRIIQIQQDEDLSFQHLLAELARIDVLIMRQVRLWQAAGQDPNDAFRGLYTSDETAAGLLDRPLGANWGVSKGLDPDEAGRFENALERARGHAQSLLQEAGRLSQNLRLAALAKTFELDDFDLDAFLICISSSLDLRYERLFGYLQDDVTRKRPSVNLVLDLLCPSGPRRLAELSHFQPGSPLLDHHLLGIGLDSSSGKIPLLNQVLAVDESVVSWLLGHYHPNLDIRRFIEIQEPQAALHPDDAMLAGAAIPLLENGAFEPGAALSDAVLVCYGPDLISQEAAARGISTRLGKPLFKIDLEALTRLDRIDPYAILQLALRDARMVSAIPLVMHVDHLFSDGAPQGGLLPPILEFPGLVILSGRTVWQMAGYPRERRFSWLEFPAPSFNERRARWSYFLKQAGLDQERDLASLAGQFVLTSGQIRDVIATAMDWAVQRGGTVDIADLQAAARLHSSSHLAGLARKIVPRYTWQDIILPPDQLEILKEIINTVQARPLVLTEWGLGQKLVASSGVTVLFAGPPGTGKTMAAEIIAGELGLDLYKIDLSTIVSKYIGETEKNLEHIFLEAETSNAILFFDEADALFGKRSEVRDSHDRYANIEISFLLQRMEAYAGITILATNLRSNLDDAFTRRLQFAVDFPFPEEEERLHIWQALFPAGAPREDDLDLKQLARRYKLAGGNIRNIIVNAAYLAAADGGKISMAHLVHGARRELQKMGRLAEEQGSGWS
jgi:hypothetical protein